jgi:hypothetical protein
MASFGPSSGPRVAAIDAQLVAPDERQPVVKEELRTVLVEPTNKK